MCRQLFTCEMYEGKNIHYSPVDNKPLCSFSQKQCNQRRLNGYGFCVRHILEDPTAPFRRCAYVAKSSQHLCTQAIPQGEQRQYCNNHMQVLGMLPRRERKPKKEKDKDKEKEKISKEKEKVKDKDNLTLSEPNKMTFGDRLKSKKLTVPKPATSPLWGKVLNPVDDPDDPYAFHDAAPDVSPVSNSMAQTGSSGVISGGLSDVASRSPCPQSLPSPSQSRSFGEGMVSGSLSKAKLYPELAEKLEKVRSTPETKTAKSRSRSSRTMNKLQTKIAQNKIKDKLRKSQESNQAELSPSQVASPERIVLGSAGLLNSGIVGTEFTPVPRAESGSVGLSATQLHSLTLSNFNLSRMDNSSTSGRAGGVGGLPGAAPHLLGMDRLNQGSVPSPLLSPLHSLPPPYPGLPVHREPPFSPSHHGQVSVGAMAGQKPVDQAPVTTSMSSHTSPSPYISFSQASSLSSPVVSPAQSQPHHLHQQHKASPHTLQQPSQLLPSHQPQSSQAGPCGSLAVDVPLDSTLSPHHAPVLNQNLPGRHHAADLAAGNAFPQTSAILSSNQPKTNPLLSPSQIDVGCSLDLRPPPPYVPRFSVCSIPTSVTNQSSVLTTRVHRPKGVLTEKEAHSRLRNDDAVKLYGMYVHQRINNHVFIEPCMSLCASDEDESTDDEMNDERLPYQRDWRVLSDDEEDNESEEDGELPSDLRMVKLGVMRARYRRHCTQTKHATRINTKSMAANKKFTLALLKLARERPSTAAHTLAAIYNKPLQWPQERKSRPKSVWRKVCQYKDGADKQCTVMCLPYSNHCRKHIMYNVDQQLFQFCTGKNCDNTQCCMPVIDIRHDFPLCFPHALRAEQQQQEEAAEVKKRPRKKTKPPALTRPPRKGKKKKGKNARPQKPWPPDKPVRSISMPTTELMEISAPAVPDSQPDSSSTPAAPPASQAPTTTTPPPPPPPPPAAAAVAAAPAVVASVSLEGAAKEKVAQPSTSAGAKIPKDTRPFEQALSHFDLDETLSPDFDKPFELPLEQASRLLEDQDFENFPDDAFNDIFSMADKNGESEALAKENDKLERQLAYVTDNVRKTKETFEKLLTGEISMDDLPEHETKQLAEVISMLPSISGEGVPYPDMVPTTVSSGLDPCVPIPRDQGMSTMQPMQQLPQTQPLPDFSHLASAAGAARGLVGEPPVSLTSASYLPPAGTSTSVNGITLSQTSITYNQALLASLSAGYQGSPGSIGQQAGGVHGAGQVYSSDNYLSQGYHMAPTTGQGQMPGFQGLHGLPSAAVLLSGTPGSGGGGGGGVGGDVTAVQQQALLANHLNNQPVRVSATTSHPHHAPSPSSLQAMSRDVGGGILHAPPQGSSSHPPSTAGTLPGSSPVVNSHLQAGASVVTVHHQQTAPPGGVSIDQGPSTSGLSQGQFQAQLSSTWAALQQQQQQQQQQGGLASGYHLNGFPTTQLAFTNTTSVTRASSVSKQASAVAAQQAKYSSLNVPGHINNVTLAGLGPGVASVSLSNVNKHEHHLGGTASTIMVNPSPSPPVTGLKQDPRIAALAQQHSRAAGRSGSPSLPGFVPVHSPSPPTHSPQGLNQTLPPFTSALPAYQGTGTGS